MPQMADYSGLFAASGAKYGFRLNYLALSKTLNQGRVQIPP